MNAAPLSTTVCPACKVQGPVRLGPGEVCEACKARRAWERWEGEGKLVIGRADIDEAVRRREGEAAGAGVVERTLPFLPSAVSLALGAAAIVAVVVLMRPRPIGAPSELLAVLGRWSWYASASGLAALVASVVGLVWLKRRRQFRSLPLLATHLAPALAGGVAMAVGIVHVLSTGGGFGTQHLSMPTREKQDLPSPFVDRIMDATAVIVAPDSGGDARGGALGTGAIIAGDTRRAWLVTCSHVAMPYVAVGAWRRAAEAHPVWIQLADGRSAVGKVRWTARPPLDVALVEVPLDNAPRPVAISPDSGDLGPGARVTFVPNPYRSGWKVHHGSVLRRERHDTPAGEYSLLYTDLPVQPGDSGSGLFDELGRLVGLNTWTRLGPDGPHGISLPSEAMRALVDAIEAGRLDSLDELLPPSREKVAR